MSGRALTQGVKQCVTLMKGFAPHCLQGVRNKWPNADQHIQRIPIFYFNIALNKYFTYYYEFGFGEQLFESYKCIIYEILDCIRTEYKDNCIGISFGAIDEVIHLFAMEMQV